MPERHSSPSQTAPDASYSSGLPLIKEWAYAGIMFELTGAASASIATGGEWWHVAAPLSIAVLVAASRALRPKSRRLPGATIRGLRLPGATIRGLGLRPSQG